MRKRIIYQMNGLYRDDFRITGYEFGEGENAVCIVGSSRGNEVQQIYCCSKLIKKFRQLEAEGRIEKGQKILIIPSMNSSSMNIQKRFWPTDNTDINRMFPGYDLGETTQRIADGVFRVSFWNSVYFFLYAGRFCAACPSDGGRIQQNRTGRAVWTALCSCKKSETL